MKIIMAKKEKKIVPPSRENDEVDNAYRKVSGKRPTARQIAERKKAIRNRKIAIISACSVILLVLIGLIIYMFHIANRPQDDERILNNVYAGGVNLSGLTREEARNALHLATDNTFSRKDMVVKFPDATITLPASETGAKLDVDKVVEAAYNYGRSGNASQNKLIQQNSANTPYTIALLSYMELDTKYIQNTLKDFCDSYSSSLTPPTDTISGERPVYDVKKPNKPVTHQVLTITMGTPDYRLDFNRLYDRVLDSYSLNQLEITYESPDQIEPQVPVAQELFDRYCTLPEDAKLDQQLNIIPEVYGYGFDVETLQKRIDNAKHGETIQVTLNFLYPHVTTEDLSEDVLPDVLVEYVCANPDATAEWIHNMKLVCEALNGTVLNSGDVFSFNKIVNEKIGRISEANGFKKAPGYVRGMEADVLGAGIEQVASALFYSALMCDFNILERHNNGYAVNYIDLGLDAYITATQDLQFSYAGKYPVRINLTMQDHAVKVVIEGTESRIFDIELKVDIEDQIDPETIYQVMDKDNVYGYEDGHILVSGITGYTAKLYRVYYNKQTGNEAHRSVIRVSTYSKRDQTEVQIESDPIPEPEPEPEPEPTTPEDGGDDGGFMEDVKDFINSIL